VRPHHVLLVLELIQRPCLILINQLDRPLDPLSRALHVLVDAEGSGRLSLAHLLHEHLRLKQLLVGFVSRSYHEFDRVDDRGRDVLPGVRLEREDG
jgi:hypothetical protein